MSYGDWRDAFSDALDERFYTIDHLDELLMAGTAWFWENDTAAIVAEAKQFPTGLTVLHGLVAAGALDGIKVLVGEAEQWAKAQGAAGAMISSREGWARAMRKSGYAPFQTMIFKQF